MINPNNPESTSLVKTNPLDQIVVSPKDKIAAQGTALDANKVAEEDYKRQIRQKELDKQELVNKELSDNIEARKKYAGRLFAFLCIYMIIVFIILLLQGFNKIKLEASVLNTLLVTVTANVIGIYMLVANRTYAVDAGECCLS